MMTELEIRKLFDEAKQETSAKRAVPTLVFREEGIWSILFECNGEELLIRIAEGPDASEDSIKQEIRRKLMRLF